MPQGVLQAPRGHPAGHVCKWGVTADCIGLRLTLPTFHVATEMWKALFAFPEG